MKCKLDVAESMFCNIFLSKWLHRQSVSCSMVYRILKSTTEVQRKLRTTYTRCPPSRRTIYLNGRKDLWRQTAKTENLAFLVEASGDLSEFQKAQRLQTPRSTVHDVAHAKMQLCACKLQLLHELSLSTFNFCGRNVIKKWWMMKIVYYA